MCEPHCFYSCGTVNRMKMGIGLVFTALLLVCMPPSANCGDAPAAADFNTLVDQYFNFYFSFHPAEATAAGFHQYDTKLEDYSESVQQKQIQGLKEFLAKFEAVNTSKRPADVVADRDWITSSVRSQLLELEN